MKILKINLIKEEFNDNEKNPLEMKLIKKIKIIINIIENIIELKKTSIKIEKKY